MQKKLVLISPTSQRLVELFGLDEETMKLLLEAKKKNDMDEYSAIYLRVMTKARDLKEKCATPEKIFNDLKVAVKNNDVEEMVQCFEDQEEYRILFKSNLDLMDELQKNLETLELAEDGQEFKIYHFQFIDEEGNKLTNEVWVGMQEDGSWRIIAF